MQDKDLAAKLYDELLVCLPGVLQQKDEDHIMQALEQQGVWPLAPTSQQHLLCEYRKAKVPSGRPWGTSTTSSDDYFDAWNAACPAYR